MNFVDETINFVKAGNGGNGIISFRREKYVSHGGPDGGNGGNGGSIIFIGDSDINTLSFFKYSKRITAENGKNGGGKKKNGANASDLLIKVPLGTVVYNYENNFLIGEILKNQEKLIIAKGGRGGRGNYFFTNSKNRSPSFAEKGDLGESFAIKLELKILADVGLIGLPNVGKSSLISCFSNSSSPIGNYPFTTIKPFLGIVKNDDFNFTMADLPGLIKNAHLGRGIGIRFLKHIERCKILVHFCSVESDNLYEDYLQLKEELKYYNSQILKKPCIIVLNKMDLENSLLKFNEFRKKIPNALIIGISIHENLNLNILKKEIIKSLKTYNEKQKFQNVNVDDLNIYEHRFFKLTEENENFSIFKDSKGYFVVQGKIIYKLFNRVDLNNYESVRRFSYMLKNMGVEEELKKKGMTEKDKVNICGYIFELVN